MVIPEGHPDDWTFWKRSSDYWKNACGASVSRERDQRERIARVAGLLETWNACFQDGEERVPYEQGYEDALREIHKALTT